ncbi:MAG: C25 family cysteine peptidase, partial [Cyclobacteriaceae bacterium]|nr:C25 family cysteine peptidase [Cyclobacteriaceae bacterium]
MNRFLAMIFLLQAFLASGQYSNSWIDFNQAYYKMKVAQEGICQLDYDDLMSAGIPPDIDPRAIQIFHRGKEMAIFVKGQEDAALNPGDLLTFYARPNDGTLDKELYVPSNAQPHSYYNLYSDSTAYFLTWKLNSQTGKRITSYKENNISGLPPRQSRVKELIKLNTNRYAQGRNLINYAFLTHFDYGEGWTGNRVQENQSLNYTISGISNTVPGDGVPSIEVQVLGESAVIHVAEIFVGPDIGSLRSLGELTVTGFSANAFAMDIAWTDISASGDLQVRVLAKGLSGGQDLLSVPYVKVRYPASYDLAATDRSLILPVDPVGKSFVEMINTPVTPVVYDITDPYNVIDIGYNQTGSGLNMIVNSTGTERRLWVGAGKIIPRMERVTMRVLDHRLNDFLIISHRNLMRPAGSYPDVVRAYAGYRNSTLGGGYDTLVVDIDQLYNQFSYGEITPLAIYRFIEFMSQAKVPGFLFLIGKSLSVPHGYYRNPTAFTYPDLVPTAGFPASDNAFAAGLLETNYVPAFPVGRITALTPDEVLAYLEKVKEMEKLPFDNLWRKNILHLSGGINAVEQATFFNFTEGFRSIAEGPFLGGKVKTIRKNTAETVTQINIADEVNEGLNLVTFFGHSNPLVTDIDIGFATDPLNNYNNKGKYPAFVINGCNAGLVFNNNRLFGEDWILAKDRGALAFVAHSSYGHSSLLRAYTEMLYTNAYAIDSMIDKSFGEAQVKTVKDYLDIHNTVNLWHPAMAQQMIFLGDPSVKLFNARKPDYAINDNALSTVSLVPGPITAQTDSFAIQIVVKNFGKALSDSLIVEVIRTLPDGTVLSYYDTFPPVFNQDTLYFTIKNDPLTSVQGDNEFMVYLDPTYSIVEILENNNVGQLKFFIPLNGVKNLLPPNYAIEGTRPVTLVFQATDPLSGGKNFIVETDTSYLFDSPAKRTYSANSTIVASVTPTLLEDVPPNDSLVYYWRTRLEQPGPDESSAWALSSFTYMKNSPTGWNKSHFPQFYPHATVSLVTDTLNRKWHFEEKSVQVDVVTYGDLNPALHTDVSVSINGGEYIINNLMPCRDHSLNLIAFNRNTAVPYAALPFSFLNPKTCGRQPQVINSFTLNQLETGVDDLFAYIDAVHQGDTVLLFTIGDIKYSQWSANVISKLGEIGIGPTTFSTRTDGEPLIILGAKGAPSGTAFIVSATVAPEAEQAISFSKRIVGVGSSGQFISTIIGPSSSWGNFTNKVRLLESPSSDQYSFDIMGVNRNGGEQVVMSGVTNSFTDISGISAGSYPFIKIRTTLMDTLNRTPPQPQRITVTHGPVPEGILWTEMKRGDTPMLQEGQPFIGKFYFTNISKVSFADSLVVHITVVNKESGAEELNVFKIPSPLPGDTSIFSFDFVTLGKKGLNDLKVFVNPRVDPEMDYSNNRIFLQEFMSIFTDNINPLIDISIDGRYILNGEIVSASPAIRVELKDENPY